MKTVGLRVILEYKEILASRGAGELTKSGPHRAWLGAGSGGVGHVSAPNCAEKESEKDQKRTPRP